ncbi:MAG TPA: hypothetical protein VEZ15_03785, partial [Acidimicrobiia bacterium]|nr:hypothetical protein [Acidimicrobiia bacterium]
MGRHDGDVESLEALPVYVDGVAVPPVPTSPLDDEFPVPNAHEVADALRATIAEAPFVMTLPPWSIDARGTPVAPPRAANFLSGFSRMIPLPARALEAFGEWWDRRARDDRVEVGGRLMLDAPHRDPAAVWRVLGRLRNPMHTRWIPVEMLLWPGLDLWTKLTGEPQGGVRVGRRYFAN